MATESAPPLSDATEGVAPVKDRITTTLFLAALFHGIVILGITFALPGSDKRPAPTLEVLLLTGADTRAADNPSAQYLAQRNQDGQGNTDERVRPANPTSSPTAIEQQGTPDGNSTQAQEAVAGTRATEFVSSRATRSEVAFQSGTERPAPAQTPVALAATPPTAIATNAVDQTLRLRGQRKDGQTEIIPNTRASAIAPYLDAWRRKVERLGTMNFPQIAHLRSGNPVLEISIRADGTLGDAVVRRSSGRKEVDQAALSILRLASPFDPFPAHLRDEYSELRFAYEWQFLEGDGTP